MRFETLLSFYTTVEQGSFTAAAKKLYVSQPAVSMGIKQLEKEYGRPLLVRKPGGGLQLTPFGEKVYDIVHDICLNMEKLERLKEEQTRVVQHEIVIECEVTAGIYLLSSASSQFRAIHPDIHISIKHTRRGDTVRNIMEGKCDLAMLMSHEHLMTDLHSKLQPLVTWEDQLELVVPSGHPLAGRPISSADLQQLSFILPVKHSPTRRILEATFKAHLGIAANCMIEMDNPEAIKQSVISLNMPGILLRSNIRKELEQGDLIPLASGLNLRCKHVLAHKKHHFQPDVVKLFAKYVLETFDR